ncbi:TPA: hypothetical protein ACSP2Y_000395 [Aeromonas veronii]
MKIFKAAPLSRYLHRDTTLEFIDRLYLKREPDRPNFNRRMFDEDFSRLFHSINSRSEDLFICTSNDDALMRKLLSSVGSRHTSRTISESILQLLEEITQSLIWCGKAFFFLSENTERQEINITSFSSNGVVRLFGKHIQLIPKRWARHWNQEDEELPREIRILDATKIMRFDIPTQLKRMLSSQNRILTILDKHQLGEIHFQYKATYENPTPTNHFDFRMWKDIQDRALYRATRSTGWDGRNGGSTNCSDFFYCHRLIRFRRNQLLLRDDILNQLSSELTRVGKSYNEEFTFEISGANELPNVTHLNELEVKLTREEVGFKEIIDYCFKR